MHSFKKEILVVVGISKTIVRFASFRHVIILGKELMLSVRIDVTRLTGPY